MFQGVKMNLKILSLLAILFIASCGNPPLPNQSAILEIQITDSESKELGTELIPKKNCDGTAELENTIQKSRTIQYIIEVQNGMSVNANGQIGFAGTDVELGTTVANYFGQSYGTSESLSRSITVKAGMGTNMEHTVRQVEVWKIGQAKISIGGQETIIPFKFRSDFAIELATSKNLGDCNTSTPPIQATPSPAIALDVYDTFDDSKYDGNINQSLWLVNPDDNMTLYQENGKLVLQASEPKDYGTLWINPWNGNLTTLQSYNAIEAKFSWEPEIKNKLYLGLTIQQSWTPQRLYACDFILVETSSFLHCTGTDNEQTHSPNDVPIVPNRVYTLRFEIDLRTAIFVIYLDNNVIDTYQPPNPEKWLQGPISYNVHLGTEPNSSGISYVDDVKFEQLK